MRISSGSPPPAASRSTYPPRAHALARLLGRAREHGSFWRVSASATGPSRRSTASAQAAAVSFASPGRTNHRFGIARRAA